MYISTAFGISAGPDYFSLFVLDDALVMDILFSHYIFKGVGEGDGEVVDDVNNLLIWYKGKGEM